MAVLVTHAGINIFAAIKLGSTGRIKYSSTIAAGAVLIGWMIYVSIDSGFGALTIIGAAVGCAQIAVAIKAGKNASDSSENLEDIRSRLPMLSARCVALAIGLGVLSLLPGDYLDSERAIWLLALAAVLLAVTRIAEMSRDDLN